MEILKWTAHRGRVYTSELAWGPALGRVWKGVRPQPARAALSFISDYAAGKDFGSCSASARFNSSASSLMRVRLVSLASSRAMSRHGREGLGKGVSDTT